MTGLRKLLVAIRPFLRPLIVAAILTGVLSIGEDADTVTTMRRCKAVEGAWNSDGPA